ncbi:hypothetical protein [Pontibacter ramchanderi]|uniref:hypothetical protein n=1 Tax=Pontibacter ramchanderi TaxID=1179743 RepID=UPI0011808FDB|nr:hypothetical protein [Pontibacter ramchanderi]
MKRFLLLLLISLTCLNLSGGYAIAAAVINSPAVSADTLPEHDRQHVLKKTSLELQVLQVNKEHEEDDTTPFSLPLLDGSTLFYSYQPDFELVNKHFLVHYGAAIKDRLPAVYILHSVFRL